MPADDGSVPAAIGKNDIMPFKIKIWNGVPENRPGLLFKGQPIFICTGAATGSIMREHACNSSFARTRLSIRSFLRDCSVVVG